MRIHLYTATALSVITYGVTAVDLTSIVASKTLEAYANDHGENNMFAQSYLDLDSDGLVSYMPETPNLAQADSENKASGGQTSKELEAKAAELKIKLEEAKLKAAKSSVESDALAKLRSENDAQIAKLKAERDLLSTKAKSCGDDLEKSLKNNIKNDEAKAAAEIKRAKEKIELKAVANAVKIKQQLALEKKKSALAIRTAKAKEAIAKQTGDLESALKINLTKCDAESTSKGDEQAKQVLEIAKAKVKAMKIRSKAKIERQVAKRVEKELELKSKEVQHAKEIAAWKIQEAQREAAHAIEKRFILEDRKTREAFDAVLHSKRDYKVDSGQEGRNKQIQEIKKEINALKKSLIPKKAGVAQAPCQIKKITQAWGVMQPAGQAPYPRLKASRACSIANRKVGRPAQRKAQLINLVNGGRSYSVDFANQRLIENAP